MTRFNDIGQVIRELRLARRWSQTELAVRAQVTGALLSSYETARKTPSLANLGRIFDALGVDLGQLDDHLDRVNERDRSAAPAGRRGRAVPGVELARFLGRQSVPGELVEPFTELILDFQTLARHLCDRMLDNGRQPPK